MNNLDPTDIRAAEQREALANERIGLLSRQEAEDFKWFLSDARGRRVMWRLLSLTGVFRSPYAGQRGDTDFLCGRQSIGQEYLGDIHEHCPDRYQQMITEKREYDQRIDSRQRIKA